jgi:hypothetical protein
MFIEILKTNNCVPLPVQTSSAFAATGKNFRRIHCHKDLWMLKEALQNRINGDGTEVA